jgi:hypothetical protein
MERDAETEHVRPTAYMGWLRLKTERQRYNRQHLQYMVLYLRNTKPMRDI